MASTTPASPTTNSRRRLIKPFRLLGLYGKRKHGKSEVAAYLVEHHGFKELAFANYLKQACQVIFGFTDEQMLDPVAKETVDPRWGVSPRQVLQVVGTELFRDRLPQLLPQLTNIWIRRLLIDVAEHQRKHPNQPLVVSDVRFPDEFNAIREHGGYLAKIVRPSLAYATSLTTAPSSDTIAAHSSETSLDDMVLYLPDRLIMNDSTLVNLHHQVEALYRAQFKQ